MRIDSQTGVVELEGIGLIGPQSMETFRASALGRNARLIAVSGRWETYSAATASGTEEFALTLLFFGARLAEIHLAKIKAGASWANWSKENELKTEEEHNRLLAAVLGQPPYQFSWGEVLSVFDPKSGASKIVVRYKPQP